jgi:coiled-coil domain-containing protein 12
MQDTVEVQVKGLAEQILAEDEKLRAQELVRFTISRVCVIVNISIGRV